MGGVDVPQHLLLKGPHPFQRHILHQTGVHRKQQHHLVAQVQRLVLPLLQRLRSQLPPGQLGPRGRIQVGGAELGEGRQLPVLRQIQAQPSRHLPHGAGLRRAAHPGHGKAHIHRRPDAHIKQLGLQVNLPVRDGNHIGRNVGGHIPGLGFNNRQRRQRAAAALVIQPRRPFQQPAVQVENVAGISLPPGGTAQQQRHLPVRPGVLGQVVIDNQDILALLHKRLAHSAPGVGGDELQRRGVGGTGVDHNGMVHCAVFLQDSHYLRHFALLLPDGDVDADQVGVPLVDDGINGDGRLAGGTVADDQLPLSPSDGDHRVNGLDARLHRRVHRLAHHHVGGCPFHGHRPFGDHRAFAVQGPPQRVDHPANQRFPHGNLNNLAGGAHPVALFHGGGVAQDGGAHDVRFQVQSQTEDVVAKIQQLIGAHALQTLNAGNAVANLHHAADVHQRQVAAELLNLAPDQRYDFLSSDCHRPVSLSC